MKTGSMSDLHQANKQRPQREQRLRGDSGGWRANIYTPLCQLGRVEVSAGVSRWPHQPWERQRKYLEPALLL